MAQYEPNEFVSEYHGKMCMHSSVSFAKRGKTMYTMKRCNARNLEKHPYTAGETKVKTLFKNTRLAIAALTTTQKDAYRAAWRAYEGEDYATLNGYIFGQEYAKAKAAYEAAG